MAALLADHGLWYVREERNVLGVVGVGVAVGMKLGRSVCALEIL